MTCIHQVCGKFKMLPNDTIRSLKNRNFIAHIFQFASCLLVSTSTNSENRWKTHGLRRPGWQIQKNPNHLFVALLPGKIQWCLASAPSKPRETWHKVSSNLLKSFLLDFEAVFLSFPKWNYLNVKGRNQIDFLPGCQHPLDQTRINALGNHIS